MVRFLFSGSHPAGARATPPACSPVAARPLPAAGDGVTGARAAPLGPDRIFRLASGFMAAKHLFVAVEMGLFEHLAEGPRSLEQLAGDTGLPARSLRIVLDAVTALGFAEKRGSRYRNSVLAGRYLSGQGEEDLRPFLQFWNRVSYPRWEALEDAVRGDGEYETARETGDADQAIVSEGIQAITAGTARRLAQTYDFSRHHRVLDLGGGTGSFLTAALTKYPDLSGTLFELPPVAALAHDTVAGAGMDGRVEVVAGDFFEDPLPLGHDVMILANVMHNFGPERNLELLRRARTHAPEGGRLLLVDFWTDSTHTQPQFAALMAGEFLLHSGEGDVYSKQELRRWLQSTGWRAVQFRQLAGPASLMVAEAG